MHGSDASGEDSLHIGDAVHRMRHLCKGRHRGGRRVEIGDVAL